MITAAVQWRCILLPIPLIKKDAIFHFDFSVHEWYLFPEQCISLLPVLPWLQWVHYCTYESIATSCTQSRDDSWFVILDCGLNLISICEKWGKLSWCTCSETEIWQKVCFSQSSISKWFQPCVTMPFAKLIYVDRDWPASGRSLSPEAIQTQMLAKMPCSETWRGRSPPRYHSYQQLGFSLLSVKSSLKSLQDNRRSNNITWPMLKVVRIWTRFHSKPAWVTNSHWWVLFLSLWMSVVLAQLALWKYYWQISWLSI